MKQISVKPIVFDYLDAISYLQDYYQYRKNNSKNFSYDSWSDELGFKSRSYVRMVIMGKKKITTKFVEAFSRLIFSNRAEEDYFFYLVSYSQSRTQKDKKIISAKLMQILKTQNSQTQIRADKDFISDPIFPRLYTLLGFKDLHLTSEKISQALEVSVEVINKCLQQLLDLQLVKHSNHSGDLVWEALHSTFKVPDDKGNLDLMKFHEMSLKDAIAAFHKPKNLRKYKSLILPLADVELNDVYLALDDFISEQVGKYSSDEYRHKKLFQLNLNLYPVANEIAG